MTLVAPRAQFGYFSSLGENPPFAMPTLDMTPAPDARARALDATSTDPWGPSRSLMEELRAYTQTRHCADILHVLHDALTSRGTHWRRILKALTTIAYCIREGSNEVALFASAHRALIKQLVHFEYVDAYRLDRGAAVREEAVIVSEMLQLGEEAMAARYPNTSHAGPSSWNSTPSTLRNPPSSSRSTTPQHNPHSHHPRHPAPIQNTNTVQLFACSPWAQLRPTPPTRQDIEEEPFRDSTRLASLITYVEASSDEFDDAWLNIYKLLFLLQTTLPTASDDIIRHWARHAHLFVRLARRKSSLGADADARADESVPAEVRRLAAELAGLFNGASGQKDVRRRAKMF